MSSISWINLKLTDCRASEVQGWNQSTVVHCTRAGNRRARTRRVLPTGDKHSTTYKEDRRETKSHTQTGLYKHAYLYFSMTRLLAKCTWEKPHIAGSLLCPHFHRLGMLTGSHIPSWLEQTVALDGIHVYRDKNFLPFNPPVCLALLITLHSSCAFNCVAQIL